MAAIPITLLEALQVIANEARRLDLPDPVIETDLISAVELACLISKSLGGAVGLLGDRHDCIAQYDGVKIVARRPDRCKLEVDEWREHFGLLAEIWS